MTRSAAQQDVIKSSGNVSADLGFAERSIELAKAELAHAISKIIEAKGWTQAEAALHMGVDQPKISAISRGRLDGFSLERLILLLNALDHVVEVTVRPAEV
jgi:predicted XRE-type DNA-binding protein